MGLHASLPVCYPILAEFVSPTQTEQHRQALVGILFAVLIEGSRIAIVGMIVKGNAGDESVDRAKANEQRMGMKKEQSSVTTPSHACFSRGTVRYGDGTQLVLAPRPRSRR